MLEAPKASGGTVRSLFRGTQLESSVGAAERQNFVSVLTVVGAPWFRVVSLTVMVEPAAADTGTFSTDTTRSGPTLTWEDAVLLVSSDSTTLLRSSARATM